MDKHQHLKNKITTVLAIVLCEVLRPPTPGPRVAGALFRRSSELASCSSPSAAHRVCGASPDRQARPPTLRVNRGPCLRPCPRRATAARCWLLVQLHHRHLLAVGCGNTGFVFVDL